MFIRNSLFWGLAHSGDTESTEAFVNSLQENSEHIQMCRGYLLYYHGDLGFESEPPYYDNEPFVSWPRTRTAIIELMAGENYSKDVLPQRRVIDALTLMSFAVVRDERFEEHESKIIRSCIDGIGDSQTIPVRLIELLENEYKRTHLRNGGS